MNISKYEAFLKTIEVGTLTKAAEQLGYTQSGMTHMLNALENECGVKLLTRDRTGVNATSDGIQLIPYFTKIIEDYKEMVNKTESLLGLDSGLIRIGSFASVSVHWMPQIIKEFNEEYPKIEFELVNGDYIEIEEWILRGNLDCGFISMPTTLPLDVTFLDRDELFVLIHEDHPNAKEDKFPVKDIPNYPFILIDESWEKELQSIYEEHNVMPNPHYTVVDDYAVMAMVECGLGISILPDLILQRTPYNIVKKELDVPAYRDIGIAVKKGGTLPPATERFLLYVKEWINKNN